MIDNKKEALQQFAHLSSYSAFLPTVSLQNKAIEIASNIKANGEIKKRWNGEFCGNTFEELWDIFKDVNDTTSFPPAVINIISMIKKAISNHQSITKSSSTGGTNAEGKIIRNWPHMNMNYDVSKRLKTYVCFECGNNTMMFIDSAEDIQPHNDQNTLDFQKKHQEWILNGKKGKQPKRNTKKDKCRRIGCFGWQAHFATGTCHECIGLHKPNKQYVSLLLFYFYYLHLKSSLFLYLPLLDAKSVIQDATWHVLRISSQKFTLIKNYRHKRRSVRSWTCSRTLPL